MAKEDFSVFAMDDRTVICCESNIQYLFSVTTQSDFLDDWI